MINSENMIYLRGESSLASEFEPVLQQKRDKNGKCPEESRKSHLHSSPNCFSSEEAHPIPLSSGSRKGCGSPVVKVSDHGRHVMSSIPAPLKACRVGKRCTFNL
ncbi:hypothetical protein TNCV_4419261 [Trichonephila clavipes]|nr:hypothetical protein TNCV_4419261 [Trichonephila clavipes]